MERTSEDTTETEVKVAEEVKNEPEKEVSESPSDNGDDEVFTENSPPMVGSDGKGPPESLFEQRVEKVTEDEKTTYEIELPTKTNEIITRPLILDQVPRLPVKLRPIYHEATRHPFIPQHPPPSLHPRSLIRRLCLTLLFTVLVVPYLVGGAWLFSLLEEQQEASRVAALMRLKNDTAILLATELRQVRPDEPLWAKYVFKYLDVYEEQLMRAAGMGGWRMESSHKWSKVDAFFYSLSLVTMTGYGSMTPRSEWGRTATVCYSLLGVPLMIAWLLSLGNFLAIGWSQMFKNLCCQYCSMDRNIPRSIPIKNNSVIKKVKRTRSNSVAPIEEDNKPLVQMNPLVEKDATLHKAHLDFFSVQCPSDEEASQGFRNIQLHDSGKQAKIRANRMNLDMEEKLNDLDHAVATVFSMIFFIVYFVFGSVIIALTGDWTVTDSLYYSFLMFMTLGPGCNEVEGDSIQNDMKHKVYYIAFLIIGYCIIFMNLNLLYKFYKPKRKWLPDELKELKGKTKVCKSKG